ncbi:PepSY domain-containing protein [Kandleria vitulina]|uniref:PepSY domain-containing protein n=1 Tax=Kandleria vitulina TaxID=1630 RepID=UPI003322F270
MKTIKIFIATLMLTLTLSIMPTHALSKSNALKIARKALPSQGYLIKSEHKKGIWDFTFKNKNRKIEWEVEVSESAKMALKLEMERKQYEGGRRYKISSAKAKSNVLKKFKNITVTKVRKTRDDGLIYRVSFKHKKYTATADVNAQTGKVQGYTKNFFATKTTSAIISKDKAVSIAKKRIPNANLRKVKLEVEKGTLVYEVELIKGRIEYEVTINAKTGKIIEVDID